MWVFHYWRIEKPVRECLLWVLVIVSEQTRWIRSFNKGFRVLEKGREYQISGVVIKQIPTKLNQYITREIALYPSMWSIFCFYVREKKTQNLLLSLSATTGHAWNCFSVLFLRMQLSKRTGIVVTSWQSHEFLSVRFYKCQPVTQWHFYCKIGRPVHFPSSLFSWFQIYFLLPIEVKIRN